jgi:hypothetical protein
LVEDSAPHFCDSTADIIRNASSDVRPVFPSAPSPFPQQRPRGCFATVLFFGAPLSICDIIAFSKTLVNGFSFFLYKNQS